MMKAIKPPPIAETAAKPIVGPIADTVNAKPLFALAIELEIFKSKKDPKIIPNTAKAQAISKGILMFFIL